MWPPGLGTWTHKPTHLGVWPLELGRWTRNPHILTRQFVLFSVVLVYCMHARKKVWYAVGTFKYSGAGHPLTPVIYPSMETLFSKGAGRSWWWSDFGMHVGKKVRCAAGAFKSSGAGHPLTPITYPSMETLFPKGDGHFGWWSDFGEPFREVHRGSISAPRIFFLPFFTRAYPPPLTKQSAPKNIGVM